MGLDEVRESWTILGAVDPMWAILTDDGSKLGNRWDQDEFFESGRREIASVMREIECLTTKRRFDAVMDFGCGIGRLSKALAPFAGHVTGVDIAPSMVEKARTLDPEGQCEFVVNNSADLQAFAPNQFDLIYSSIVLQHVPREAYCRYIREFRGILCNDGMLVFQMPDRRPRTSRFIIETLLGKALPFAPRWIIDAYRRRKYDKVDAGFLKSLPRVLMRTNGYAPGSVIDLLTASGFHLLAMKRLEDVGTSWGNYRYFAVRTR